MTMSAPTFATRIIPATRAGLSERQSATTMTVNATSAATSAKADRTWSERIQSSRLTG